MLQLLDRLITDMKLEVITHSHALGRYFDIELHAVERTKCVACCLQTAGLVEVRW